MSRLLFCPTPEGYRAVRGDVLRRVQAALAKAGAAPGAIDGIYGHDTEAALKHFQTAQSLPADGTITVETWTRLMKVPPPPVLERCLQLTGDFEGHGFQKVAGNFDGAGLTWGIIGFTLMHGELQKILKEVQQRYPDLIGMAFGPLKQTLEHILLQPWSQQLEWANNISIGTDRYRVDPAWEQAFSKLGSFQAVQGLQLERMQKFWKTATTDARRLGLDSELGLALCFDIAVQNGGIGSSEFERIQAKTAGVAEADKRCIIANVVAESSRPQYIEDVRQRKLAIATGEGSVHQARYRIEHWGLSEAPWRTT